MNVLLGSVFSFVIGSCAGSCVDCLGERYVSGKNWLKGRSCCNHCGHELSWHELIPVLSFIMQKGKCRFCGQKIGSRCFVTEIVMAVIYVLLFLRYERLNLVVLYNWSVIFLLSAASIVDLLSYEVPDTVIHVLAILGIVRCFLYAGTIETFLNSLRITILAGISLAGFVLIISMIVSLLKRKMMMGGGDIRLLFGLGMILGFERGMLMLVIACLSGLCFVLLLRQSRIPFVPSLTIGTCVVLLL